MQLVASYAEESDGLDVAQGLHPGRCEPGPLLDFQAPEEREIARDERARLVVTMRAAEQNEGAKVGEVERHRFDPGCADAVATLEFQSAMQRIAITTTRRSNSHSTEHLCGCELKGEANVRLNPQCF